MQEGQKSMTMMASSSARNSTGMPVGNKKPRKPYKITRPREKWAADGHDRFLHALLQFGRDWKRVEQLVATKTATHHAQKYFLKAQKLGLTAALPPPQPRRGAVLSQLAASHPDGDGYGNAAVGMTAAPAWTLPATSPPPPMSSTDFAAPSGAQQQQQSADWPCVHEWPTSSSGPTEAGWAGDDAVLQEDDTFQLLPLSPDDPRLAMVYRFVGDVFGAGAPRPVEAQLQRLQGVDPVVVDTILLVLSNLQDNLFD